jgi:hypothetical protein
VREEQEEFLVFPFSPDVFLFFARSTSRPPLRSFSFSDSSPSSSFPFLLVDRVVELVPQKYAVGYKVRATFSPPRKWRERERENEKEEKRWSLTTPKNPKNPKTKKNETERDRQRQLLHGTLPGPQDHAR